MTDQGRTTDRGRLLFEYLPPRAHPIVYAGLILTGFVFLMGSLENLLRDRVPLVFIAYAAPFILLLAVYMAGFPEPVRIHAEGIAPGRPLVLRWYRPFVRWDDLEAVYPSFYDVTGAFVSPFASSDGKVTQMGLGLEYRDGRTETVRFTPTRFSLWQQRSAGYEEALTAVRHALAAKGRPLVVDAPTYSDEEKRRMVEEASRPFLPFFAIVLLFASAAPVLAVLLWLEVPIWVALPLCLVAPVAVSVRSHRQSRRRNAVLDALSKSAEYERNTGGRHEQGA